MDKFKYFIAVASTDGIVVNSHFGQAGTFRIYGITNDNSFVQTEIRKLTPVCDGGDHDDDRLRENAGSLSDCRYVLVSRIGPGAVNVLAEKGIAAMEIPNIVEEAIKKVISYDEVQNLFN